MIKPFLPSPQKRCPGLNTLFSFANSSLAPHPSSYNDLPFCATPWSALLDGMLTIHEPLNKANQICKFTGLNYFISRATTLQKKQKRTEIFFKKKDRNCNPKNTHGKVIQKTGSILLVNRKTQIKTIERGDHFAPIKLIRI